MLVVVERSQQVDDGKLQLSLSVYGGLCSTRSMTAGSKIIGKAW